MSRDEPYSAVPGPDALASHTWDVLEDRVLALLGDCPGGIGEYELLKRLQAEDVAPFTTLAFDDSLALFRHHFVLYHVLYRIADRLARERIGTLDIDPLCIRLRRATPASTSLPHDHDPLRRYYSDLENLAAMDRAALRDMLGRFWSGHEARAGRSEALAVLGLSDPVSDADIKRRYRRLAQDCHPDRGGDTERLQALNAAMATLARVGRG
ncbi:MAG TPA: DNA-J related domain-containing protein [Gammaproteobacteria bacterium]|nr:DNA-J related domain-containing protein [Gammaproteobacteria bacterium]